MKSGISLSFFLKVELRKAQSSVLLSNDLENMRPLPFSAQS